MEVVQTLNIGKLGDNNKKGTNFDGGSKGGRRPKVVSEKPQLTDANASLASIVERPQDEHGTEMVT